VPLELIAKACHEANRVLTGLVGDVPVQPSWEDAPQDMCESSLRGVEYAIAHPGATPEDQHSAWCADKRASGWVYGPAKDAAARTHPALVPYSELAPGTRAKDALFRSIVRALVDS
jgi:hypothetical protein